jgi:hypothetical protein
VPDDKEFDDFVRRHAAGYRAGAEPPADEIWRGIEAQVQAAIQPPAPRFARRSVWLVIGAAIAATLVVGVAIGRWSAVPHGAPHMEVAASADSARLAAHLHATTVDYLEDAQVFLTEFRADLRADRPPAGDRARRSRELLARTRLLLGNPAAQSPTVNRLLEDLELLLAEIAALPDSGRGDRSMDATLLEEALKRDDILPRIRTTLPRPAGT